MSQFHSKIKALVLDVGYKIPPIAKKILDDHKLPILPYKRPMTDKKFFKKKEFKYDKENDYFICPNNQQLCYSTTTRDGYRTYKSDPKRCKDCPLKHKCTESKNNQKVISVHVWNDSLEYADQLRGTDYHKDVYKRRKETVERNYGEGKENNTLRYTRYKGVKKNQDYLTLLFANMKKIALWTDNLNKKYEKYRAA